MARGFLRVYRTYSYVDKNPVIDKVRTLIQDEGLMKELKIVHEISGVSTSTLDNWFNGETRSPQHATIAAVITSLGYEETFQKKKDIDIEKEREVAAAWLEKQERKGLIKKDRAKSNGHRKPRSKR
jgi:transcriptional regulator with XRE-family HTH domain